MPRQHCKCLCAVVLNCRSGFIINPPMFQHFNNLKGKFLNPFVLAKIAGKTRASGFQAILTKLSANPGYPIASKEDSLLLRELLDNFAVDLLLNVEEAPEEQDPEEHHTLVIGPQVLDQSPFNDRKFLVEVIVCVVNLDVCIALLTSAWDNSVR